LNIIVLLVFVNEISDYYLYVTITVPKYLIFRKKIKKILNLYICEVRGAQKNPIKK